MIPPNALPDKSRFPSFDNFPNETGMSPAKWLLLKFSLNNCPRLPISSGILPVKLLLYKVRTLNRDNFPSSGGIWPEILLPSISKFVRFVHSPHCAERLPTNRLLLRLINELIVI
ncbi:hypothetical protein BT93_A0289 [Corymbia citriodora subsp. variegata]|nr:hypothetical protein BT93_A0289 [Corymbia citriodora subsp. variegata]